MVFQFEHVGLDHGSHKWDRVPLDLRDLKASMARWQTGLAERGWNSLYWNNHDQPRAVSRFATDEPKYRVAAAKLLGTVLHLHRGTPYVYQGEEIGMTNVPFPDENAFLDIESVNYYEAAMAAGLDSDTVLGALRVGSRDNARSPMQWDGSAHAGFTQGTPWAPVNPNYPEINAAAAVADDDSVFHHYRRVIELRHTEPAVAHGDFTHARARTTPASTPTPARMPAPTSSWWPTSPPRSLPWTTCSTTSPRGRAPSCCWATWRRPTP